LCGSPNPIRAVVEGTEANEIGTVRLEGDAARRREALDGDLALESIQLCLGNPCHPLSVSRNPVKSARGKISRWYSGTVSYTVSCMAMKALFPGPGESYATLCPIAEDDGMPKDTQKARSFGVRLATLRKAAGYTQAEFGAELGVSQRMIAFYESPESNPPATMLAAMAQALHISVDELVGVAPAKRAAKPANSRLQRRLNLIDKLGAKDKRQILQFLDTFLDRERLKQRVGAS